MLNPPTKSRPFKLWRFGRDPKTKKYHLAFAPDVPANDLHLCPELTTLINDLRNSNPLQIPTPLFSELKRSITADATPSFSAAILTVPIHRDDACYLHVKTHAGERVVEQVLDYHRVADLLEHVVRAA